MTIMALSSEESEGILLAAAARTVTTYSNPMVNNRGYRGIFLYLNPTVYTAGGVTPSIQWFNLATSAWVTWLAGTKITAATVQSWAIYPSAFTATLGATIESETPFPAGQWRLAMTVDDANSITYSVGYTYLP